MHIGHTGNGVADCCLAVVLIVLVAILVAVLVAVLVVVLILVAVLVVILVVVLILVLVLVFHFNILQVFVLRLSRYSSIPRNLGFILRFKNQTDQKTAEYSGGNAACSSF